MLSLPGGLTVSAASACKTRVSLRAVRPLFAVALMTAMAPVELPAQGDVPAAGTVAFEVRGGVGLPLGTRSLDAVTEPGASLGGGVSVHLTRHVALSGKVDYQLLREDERDAGVRVPGMDILTLTGGLAVRFVEPENPWWGALFLGGGVSQLKTDETLSDGSAAPVLLDATALTFRGGLELGYRPFPSVDLFVEPSVLLMTLDENLTEPYSVVAPALQEPFELGWVLPLHAGVRIGL